LGLKFKRIYIGQYFIENREVTLRTGLEQNMGHSWMVVGASMKKTTKDESKPTRFDQPSEKLANKK